MRRLRADELHHAPPLLAPEGWLFSVEELRRLHRVGGAVGAFEGGRMVGFLTFVDLPPWRWVGNVVVAPALRGAGVGARMMAETQRDAPRLGLYAVEKAETLYARGGLAGEARAVAFRADERPRREGEHPSGAHAMRPQDMIEVFALDRGASGMDRTRLLDELLRAFPETAFVARRNGRAVGFGFAKTSPEVTDLGPLVAQDAEAAEAVLDALLLAAPPPYEVTVLRENLTAPRLLGDRGFEPRFTTRVMTTGGPVPWRPDRLFAAAALEKG